MAVWVCRNPNESNRVRFQPIVAAQPANSKQPKKKRIGHPLRIAANRRDDNLLVKLVKTSRSGRIKFENFKTAFLMMATPSEIRVGLGEIDSAAAIRCHRFLLDWQVSSQNWSDYASLVFLVHHIDQNVASTRWMQLLNSRHGNRMIGLARAGTLPWTARLRRLGARRLESVGITSRFALARVDFEW